MDLIRFLGLAGQKQPSNKGEKCHVSWLFGWKCKARIESSIKIILIEIFFLSIIIVRQEKCIWKPNVKKHFSASWKPLCLFWQTYHTYTDCHTYTERENLSVSSQEDHYEPFLLIASCGMYNPLCGFVLSGEPVVCKQPQVD